MIKLNAIGSGSECAKSSKSWSVPIDDKLYDSSTLIKADILVYNNISKVSS